MRTLELYEYVLIAALIGVVIITALSVIGEPEQKPDMLRFNSQDWCVLDGNVWHPRTENGWCYLADKPK